MQQWGFTKLLCIPLGKDAMIKDFKLETLICFNSFIIKH
jgi:hypothetical protein